MSSDDGFEIVPLPTPSNTLASPSGTEDTANDSNSTPIYQRTWMDAAWSSASAAVLSRALGKKLTEYEENHSDKSEKEREKKLANLLSLSEWMGDQYRAGETLHRRFEEEVSSLGEGEIEYLQAMGQKLEGYVKAAEVTVDKVCTRLEYLVNQKFQ